MLDVGVVAFIGDYQGSPWYDKIHRYEQFNVEL